MSNLLFFLKVSRPGLWFATVWLYMMPLSGLDLTDQWTFWVGLFYICFPLNFLVYGWNDIADYEIDLNNPRKDSFLFGARGSKEQLKQLPIAIGITQIVFLPLLFNETGLKIIGLYSFFLLINHLYNKNNKPWSSSPPLELIVQFAYVLVVPMSILINDVPNIPIAAYIYLALFALQSHLIGEVMDMESDKKAGRVTTATIIGIKKTKLCIIGIVMLECSLLFFYFQDYIFGGMLLGALIWLLLDLFVIYKTKTYTLNQMKLFGIMSNIVALLSMAYVWKTGCLSI